MNVKFANQGFHATQTVARQRERAEQLKRAGVDVDLLRRQGKTDAQIGKITADAIRSSNQKQLNASGKPPKKKRKVTAKQKRMLTQRNRGAVKANGQRDVVPCVEELCERHNLKQQEANALFMDLMRGDVAPGWMSEYGHLAGKRNKAGYPVTECTNGQERTLSVPWSAFYSFGGPVTLA